MKKSYIKPLIVLNWFSNSLLLTWKTKIHYSACLLEEQTQKVYNPIMNYYLFNNSHIITKCFLIRWYVYCTSSFIYAYIKHFFILKLLFLIFEIFLSSDNLLYTFSLELFLFLYLMTNLLTWNHLKYNVFGECKIHCWLKTFLNTA